MRFAIYILIGIMGAVIGYNVRLNETHDRYLQGLAEQHEAAAKYYNERTDQLIHANEPKPKGAKP